MIFLEKADTTSEPATDEAPDDAAPDETSRSAEAVAADEPSSWGVMGYVGDATYADTAPEPTGEPLLSLVPGRRFFNTVRPDPMSREPLRWRSSGFTEGGDLCVLVAQVRSGPARGGFLVRDTRTDGGAVLAFSEAEWIAFIEDIESFRGGFI